MHTQQVATTTFEIANVIRKAVDANQQITIKYDDVWRVVTPRGIVKHAGKGVEYIHGQIEGGEWRYFKLHKVTEMSLTNATIHGDVYKPNHWSDTLHA